MMRTDTHAITSKGYVPLSIGDPDESNLDYPLATRSRASSLSVLSPSASRFSSRLSSRRTPSSKVVAREVGEGLCRARDCSPPPNMYQRTASTLDLEQSRRALQFVSSWEGILEQSDDSVDSISCRVSVCSLLYSYMPSPTQLQYAIVAKHMPLQI